VVAGRFNEARGLVYEFEKPPSCRAGDSVPRKSAPREKALQKARVPLRESIRDHGAGVRKNRNHPAKLPRPPSPELLDISVMPEGAQFREHIKQNLAADVLRNIGQVQLAAFGYSMLPSLWPGDHLTVEVRGLEQVRVGEIVLFARSGRLFIHRAVRIQADHLVTRGDAMPSTDAPVLADELMGVVTRVQRANGRSVAIAGCSPLRRGIGLALAYSGKLRSLALRWHASRHGGPSDIPAIVEQGSTR